MLSNHPTIRLVIYGLGIVAQIASFFVTIYSPELAQAFSQTSDVLGAVALVTAATNITPKEPDHG
jgi:hypothetical protein